MIENYRLSFIATLNIKVRLVMVNQAASSGKLFIKCHWMNRLVCRQNGGLRVKGKSETFFAWFAATSEPSIVSVGTFC